jgi:hypothetical protein
MVSSATLRQPAAATSRTSRSVMPLQTQTYTNGPGAVELAPFDHE